MTSSSTNITSSSQSTTDAPAKRQQKYGGSTGSTRSRTATKDLELPPSDSLMFAPKIVRGLEDLTVKDGEQLNLNCTVRGDPEPTITWYKNDEPLSSSSILDLKYRNGNASLTINEIYPEDEGLYKCKAVNSLGSVESTCNLKVLAGAARKASGKDSAPRILEHVKSRMVNDGESVTLQCRVGNANSFDVVWLHNEKEIKPSKDFEYERISDGTDKICKLRIAEIFPEDAGTYTCEVFNDVGEAFSTCTLNVVVPTEEVKSPTFKVFPQSMTISQGQNAVFTCEADKTPIKGILLMKAFVD